MTLFEHVRARVFKYCFFVFIDTGTVLKNISNIAI